MDFDDYQSEALQKDQTPRSDDDRSIIIPLLGLAGEAGSLLSEYKKHLRDGESYQLFEEHLAEELGDILWYVANLATKFDFSLNELANKNLAKIEARWRSIHNKTAGGPRLFDELLPKEEQFPRECTFIFDQLGDQSIKISIGEEQIGNYLTDNSYGDDGYRFHDIMHVTHMVYLGWSPVMRKILCCKRKSDPKIDEIEDGGRATAIEEGIVALVFSYAGKHSYLEGIDRVDFSLLKQVKDVVSHLEVSNRSWAAWEATILKGYEIWRQLLKHRGGSVACNLIDKKMVYRPPYSRRTMPAIKITD